MNEKNKNIIVTLISFMFIGAFWRRWFGGGFGKYGEISRFWKYLVLAIIVILMYYFCGSLNWQNWRMYAVVGSFSYHWARSHGDYFYVWHTTPDEGRIWWIDQVLRLIYGEGNYYNFKGNVTGLFLRYTSTACIVAACIPNAWFIISGLLTTLAYIATSKVGTGKTPVQTAEWFSGALNFGLLYLCILYM